VATPVEILDRDAKIFRGLGSSIDAGRYHSWVVASEGLPACLKVTATDAEGYIMGLQHTSLDVCGVQFHPESVLTPEGEKMMRNWLK
jgi:anthranilate synthase component 2